MHRLLRCKHERRCSRAQSGRVIQRCYNKNPRQMMWPGTWVTSRTGSMDWDLKSQLSWVLSRRKKVDFRSLAEALWQVSHVAWGEGKVSRERWYLSPYVENPFNSKVIKSFVPELRSRKCFSCFGISMFYVYMSWTFYVRFTYPYHGYVTFRIGYNRYMRVQNRSLLTCACSE